MTTSPLFNREAAPSIQCPRCGRLFEETIELVNDEGSKTRIRGHVQGDPVLCIPLPGLAAIRGDARDAHARRAGRRGR